MLVPPWCRVWLPRNLSDERFKTYGIGPASLSPTPDTVQRLAPLEQSLGYIFQNKWLIIQALTHPSYGRRPWPTTDPICRQIVMGDYQRLEFLGDALLDFMIITHLFKTHPDWDPGRLTAEKSALVGNRCVSVT